VDEALAKDGDVDANAHVRDLLDRALHHMKDRGIVTVRGTRFLADLTEGGKEPVSDEDLSRSRAGGNRRSTYVLHLPTAGKEDLLFIWDTIQTKAVAVGVDDAVERALTTGATNGTIPASVGSKVRGSKPVEALTEARKP
jgi:hypothetical protein